MEEIKWNTTKMESDSTKILTYTQAQRKRERLRNLNSLKEKTPKKKINKKGKRGIKKLITSYRKDIFQVFYNEKELEKALSRFKETYQTENLSDAFRDYMERISDGISNLLDKAKEYLGESFKNGTEKLTNKDGETIKFDAEEDEQAIRVLTEEQQNHLQNMKTQTKEVIDNTIAKGLKKGKPVEKIAKDIKDQTRKTSQGKALRIARSEVVKSHAVGQVQTMKQAGVETYNFIISPDYTGKDGKTYPCKLCRKLQGSTGREKIYDVNKAGQSQENPLPVINSHPNCNCTVVIRESNANKQSLSPQEIKEFLFKLKIQTDFEHA